MVGSTKLQEGTDSVSYTHLVLGMKHFPVQIIGGIVLHQGRIAEMKTGEGKTLVATPVSYTHLDVYKRQIIS